VHLAAHAAPSGNAPLQENRSRTHATNSVCACEARFAHRHRQQLEHATRESKKGRMASACVRRVDSHPSTCTLSAPYHPHDAVFGRRTGGRARTERDGVYALCGHILRYNLAARTPVHATRRYTSMRATPNDHPNRQLAGKTGDPDALSHTPRHPHTSCGLHAPAYRKRGNQWWSDAQSRIRR
jgi:hypothetical protein